MELFDNLCVVCEVGSYVDDVSQLLLTGGVLCFFSLPSPFPLYAITLGI